MTRPTIILFGPDGGGDNTQNYSSHVDAAPKKDKELLDLISKLTDDKN